MAANNSETATFYKREITMGQLLGFAIALVTLLGANWWTMAMTTSRNDVRILALESATSNMSKSFGDAIKDANNRTDAQFQRINDKMDVLIIKVENKKDK